MGYQEKPYLDEQGKSKTDYLDDAESDPENYDSADYPPMTGPWMRDRTLVWVLLAMVLILGLPYIFSALDWM